MKYRFIADQYRDNVAALRLNCPADWMNFSVQSIIVDRTSETRRLKPPAPLPDCYAKIYRYPEWRDRLRIILRGGLTGRSRGQVEYDNLKALHERGLAPRVIGYGETRRYGFLSETLLVVEEVTGSVPLDIFIAGNLRSFTEAERYGFIRSLAAFTRKMNSGGFVNSEYHWRNILVRRTDGGFSFQVIDPSGSRRRYRLLYPLFDLATLDVCAPFFFTRTERLRFFKLYRDCLHTPLTEKQKQQIKKTAALRRRICGKELKRYRRILPAGAVPVPAE